MYVYNKYYLIPGMDYFNINTYITALLSCLILLKSSLLGYTSLERVWLHSSMFLCSGVLTLQCLQGPEHLLLSVQSSLACGFVSHAPHIRSQDDYSTCNTVFFFIFYFLSRHENKKEQNQLPLLK